MNGIDTTISRRGFLKAGAASAALASAGALTLDTWQAEQAHAEGFTKVQLPSTCNGCSNKCGLWADILGDRLWRVEGNEDHPSSKGTLCARGHGFAQFVYSEERLTQPLKRTESGDFEPISWDDALSEIGQKVKDILAKYGPESIATIQDPRPSGSFYMARFTQALGSPNFYTHGAACNLSKESGNLHTLGGSFSADVPNAKMLIFIGRSYADGIKPSDLAKLADKALEGGSKIVMVDPRYNASARFADEWLPIIPGTDLAFVLGMSNVLVTEDLYDKEFVEEYVLGFDEYKEQLATYTPEWASKICGIDADTIARIAREMAKAAPAAVIEPSWRAAFGCAHKNSFETARGIAAFNALLGNYGQKGGAKWGGAAAPKAAKLDPAKFPDVPKAEGKKLGMAEYPLAVPGMGTNLAVLKAALDGKMHAIFFYNSNASKGYAQPKVWKEGLEKVDLVVAIDVQMTETPLLAHYVLPECTSFERMEVPEFFGGGSGMVTMRTRVVEKVHPETRPIDEIVSGLAEACGVGEYFNFTIDELVDAQLKGLGVTVADIQEQGMAKLPEKPAAEPAAAAAPAEPAKLTFKTPSGKIEFKSETVEKAGLNPVIGWVEPKTKPAADEFHFIGGKQAIHCHTMSTNIPSLMAVSKQYHLERLWVNASDAAKLGIKEGDTVEISSSEHTATVAVHVTERLRPGVVYTPTHYGGTSPYLTHANGFGICMPDFVPFDMEPGTGATMSEEVAVKLRKVEA